MGRDEEQDARLWAAWAEENAGPGQAAITVPPRIGMMPEGTVVKLHLLNGQTGQHFVTRTTLGDDGSESYDLLPDPDNGTGGQG